MADRLFQIRSSLQPHEQNIEDASYNNILFCQS